MTDRIATWLADLELIMTELDHTLSRPAPKRRRKLPALWEE